VVPKPQGCQRHHNTHCRQQGGAISLLQGRSVLSPYEPRHYENYVAPRGVDTEDGDRGHQEGPDLTVFFPQPQTFDFKGTNGASRAYLRQSYTSIEARKALAACELYEYHCVAKGETFHVVHFHSAGRMCDGLVGLIRRVCSVRPLQLDATVERTRVAVSLQVAIGHLLLLHGRPATSATAAAQVAVDNA